MTPDQRQTFRLDLHRAIRRGEYDTPAARHFLDVLDFVWPYLARDKQIEPVGDWRTWLVMAGRGFGKTRVGAEFVKSHIMTGRAKRVALVAPTAADAREVMVEGESGLMGVCPAWFKPVYEPSKRRLTWPNGAIATTYTAEKSRQLRGPQHDLAWADEIAAWTDMSAYDMLQFGLRLGSDPRQVLTTTPRPIPLVKELLSQSQVAKVPVARPSVYVTRGSTYENKQNLAPVFIQTIIKKYEGTRLGQQELLAEVLEDTPGALWNSLMFEQPGQRREPPWSDLVRIVVAVDPAASLADDASETGIIVAAKDDKGQFYVLDDRTCRDTPDGWARRVLKALDDYNADRVVAEINQGGDMVTSVLRTQAPNLPITTVRASRGKYVRAEPVAALYEQGRVFHARPFPKLEDQLCTWVPDSNQPSPDRMDALVWALTALNKSGKVEHLSDDVVNLLGQWG
jgi:predicted phage terminase large subunit-like protein